jgi:3-phenylpropionate/cinnamic acid dioxygenase small subunit
MTHMSDRRADQVASEIGIKRTLSGYCRFCDDGRFDEWEKLFAPDAVFEVMGEQHKGRAAIRAFIEAAQPPEARGRHHVTNSLIEFDSDDTASAVSDYIWLGKAGDGYRIGSAGRYHDRFRRDGDNWIFTRRAIEFF